MSDLLARSVSPAAAPAAEPSRPVTDPVTDPVDTAAPADPVATTATSASIEPTTPPAGIDAWRPIAGHVSPDLDAEIRTIETHRVGWFHLRGERLSVDEAIAAPLARVIDDAAATGLPVLGVIGGASVDPDAGPLAHESWGRIARSLVAASGIVPTIVIVDGPCTTGLSLILGLVDVVVFTRRGLVYVSGPDSVELMTGRTVTADDLGGARAHAVRSGLAHLVADDLDEAMELAAAVLDHLPANNVDGPRFVPTADPIDRIADMGAVPTDPRHPYDVRDVVAELVDDGDLLEIHAGYGGAIVCGLARLGGHPIGVVASQPSHLAGAIDIESSQKAAAFVQLCDSFGVALLTLVDTPGYRPGRDLETSGMIRFGGQLAFAYAGATVPRMCVIMRKAYGGAYIVMDCKTMGNDLCVAWPAAEIAVMGAQGAVGIVHGRYLDSVPTEHEPAERLRLEQEFAATHLNPGVAAERGLVDAVIDPASTREVLARALPTLLDRRHAPPARKHTNGPV